MSKQTSEAYTMSDSGIHGPGLGVEPISLEQFRQEPDIVLLALNQAWRAGWLECCKAARETIDAYKEVAEHRKSRLEEMIERAGKRLDAQHLDAIRDAAGIPDAGEPEPARRPKMFVGSHENLGEVENG